MENETQSADHLLSTVPRTYRFRLKPTRAQHERLRGALEHSRQLYNAALAERIDCYRKTGKGRSLFAQYRALSEYRKAGSPYSASMERAPLKAVSHAYDTFFRLGGFPRFKGRDWFKSIGWTDHDGWKFEDAKFYGKGIGSIRVQQHRDLPAKPKQARIKREGRHWYVLLTADVSCETKRQGTDVGLDLGLKSFAALSDGTLIPNPRLSRKAERNVRLRQRALRRAVRGSKRRQKARGRFASAHAQVKRARRTFHFQTASALVRNYSVIAVEDLNVHGLGRTQLAKSIHDAGWASFLKILSDKAESAGGRVVKVDARHTSQTCPDCGQVKRKKLSERTHECDCGLTLDRDVAAARVILHRAVRGPAELKQAGCGKAAPRKAVASASVIAPSQSLRPQFDEQGSE